LADGLAASKFPDLETTAPLKIIRPILKPGKIKNEDKITKESL
jgi:hypothetical protein